MFYLATSFSQTLNDWDITHVTDKGHYSLKATIFIINLFIFLLHACLEGWHIVFDLELVKLEGSVRERRFVEERIIHIGVVGGAGGQRQNKSGCGKKFIHKRVFLETLCKFACLYLALFTRNHILERNLLISYLIATDDSYVWDLLGVGV